MRSKSIELMNEIKKYIEEYYLQYRQSPSTTKIAEAVVQIPLHRITDSASNGSVFPVVTEHFSASSDHAFL